MKSDPYLKAPYGRRVFLNVPFDNNYRKMLHALICSTVCMGFVPGCALRISEMNKARMRKIIEYIEKSSISIHDLSRKSGANKAPRFNMPFELGIAYILRAKFKKGEIHVLDSNKNNFAVALSDPRDLEAKGHGNDARKLVGIVVGKILAQSPEAKKVVFPDVAYEVFLEFRKRVKKLSQKYLGEPGFEKLVMLATEIALEKGVLSDSHRLLKKYKSYRRKG
jgi:hypothetical protein